MLLIMFTVNCSPLDLFSHFLGHRGRIQCSFISSEVVITSMFHSGVSRREQGTKIQIFFRGNYAFVTIHYC